MNEELLREAFRLGQQWVHDQYNGGDAVTFNEWYNSKTTQDSLKKLRLGGVMVSDADIALEAVSENVDLIRREGFIQGAKWCRQH